MMHWATDIHLDHVIDRDAFYKKIEQCKNGLLISGDIANGKLLETILDELATVGVPIYFVLGNHDFYGISIVEGHKIARESKLTFLTQSDLIEFDDFTLLGDDGWYDLRNGIPGGVYLNDFNLIKELKNPAIRDFTIQELADKSVERINFKLYNACKIGKPIVMITHVPPFMENAVYQGKISNSSWQPYFSCRAMGDLLTYQMENFPDVSLTVLCGHSHGSADNTFDNIRCITGGAQYRNPQLQKFTI
jgi:Icc protein